MLAGIAAHPSYGYWELGSNGSVASYGAGWYGSKSDVFLDKPAAAIASTVVRLRLLDRHEGGPRLPVRRCSEPRPADR